MNKLAICLILSITLSTVVGLCTCPSIQNMVVQSEGMKLCVYKDTLGIPTIGVGFNLNRSDARTIITNMGLDYNKILAGTQCLTNAQALSLLDNDLIWARSGAATCVPSFASQPTCVQNVLIDMTYNMGKSSLCGWPNFVKQLAAFDYAGAASNMSSSTWCAQVKSRCTRDVDIIRSC